LDKSHGIRINTWDQDDQGADASEWDPAADGGAFAPAPEAHAPRKTQGARASAADSVDLEIGGADYQSEFGRWRMPKGPWVCGSAQS